MHTEQEPIKIARLDKQGRISLGNLSKGIDTYQIFEGEGDDLILKPFVDIPAHEAWLYKNPEALASVLRGLEESKQGKGTPLPERFLDVDDDA